MSGAQVVHIGLVSKREVALANVLHSGSHLFLTRPMIVFRVEALEPSLVIRLIVNL